MEELLLHLQVLVPLQGALARNHPVLRIVPTHGGFVEVGIVTTNQGEMRGGLATAAELVEFFGKGLQMARELAVSEWKAVRREHD